MRKKFWAVPITIVFILMGIMLSLQFQAQSRISSDLTMQRTENLIAMVRDLSEKRQKLAFEIIDLNVKLRTQMQTDQDEKQLTTSLGQELTKIQSVTGAISLEGPGLNILIDQHMPILYIDIIHMVNELWAAGAEAIAINDIRLSHNASIFYVEDSTTNSMYITVNNRKIDSPIIINAIGNPNNLEKGLTIPGGIIDNLALYRAYPVLTKVDSLTIPAVYNNPVFYFLNEYKPPEKPSATTQNNNTNYLISL